MLTHFLAYDSRQIDRLTRDWDARGWENINMSSSLAEWVSVDGRSVQLFPEGYGVAVRVNGYRWHPDHTLGTPWAYNSADDAIAALEREIVKPVVH